MARLATPGVYLVEKNAFASSVVQVPTAVPAFIGYTERATRNKNSLSMVPTRITSFAEYLEVFGGGPTPQFRIDEDASRGFSLSATDGVYYLYASLKLFFANGGGACYIVSVGSYSDKVAKDSLSKGLDTLLREQEPTIVVVPDAVLLTRGDCYSLYQAMLLHCGDKTKSRVSIFDIHEGYRDRRDRDVVMEFREGVGVNMLGFGAAYYPWINATVVEAHEVSQANIGNVDGLVKVLTREARALYLGTEAEAPAAPAAPAAEGGEGDKAAAKPQRKPAENAGDPNDPNVQRFQAAVRQIERLKDKADNATDVANTLSTISPLYREVMRELRRQMNLLPPSGAIAGVYSLTDNQVGVHKAPANVSVSSVISPAVSLNNDDQEDLNLPLNGKAVNAIRSFIGKGTLVWGARTLDGNSQDWRYVPVRRTMIMIEQSVKSAIEAYVFEPNENGTWLRVRTAISNFLYEVWRQGSLAGVTAAEAYEVAVGLGATMTPQDILEGVMRVTVKVAITRPAEFIVITFQQKMQES
ncbi:MAG: phage tail sheath C-terminal domain-containing protein [Bacteroidia bacterium]|nr:phage tail sheath C-terminal domain-containing protein [Bacteroidia bacterium]